MTEKTEDIVKSRMYARQQLIEGWDQETVDNGTIMKKLLLLIFENHSNAYIYYICKKICPSKIADISNVSAKSALPQIL